ncbi:MAG: hypothetical protein IK083_05485 [Abditibacteriota bacterium]|nr:hypothetical protein [Abditibacteriota bacterium]
MMKALPVLAVLWALLCCPACRAQTDTLLVLQAPAAVRSVITFDITTDAGSSKAVSRLIYDSSVTPSGSELLAETEGPRGSALSQSAVRRASIPFELTPRGMRLLPAKDKLFIGDNMSEAATVPQLSLPDGPVTPLASLARGSGDFRQQAAASRWTGQVINPFSGTVLKTVCTLVSVRDGVASISAASQKPDTGKGVLTMDSLDRQKKELGSRFALTFRDYEGTADVSYTAFFTFDIQKGQVLKAQENYYITGILMPHGQPITVADAKEKDLYITIAIKIDHNKVQGD